MNNISCIITDDEPFARKGLQGYIEKIGFLDLKGVCEDALQLWPLHNCHLGDKNKRQAVRSGSLVFCLIC
jgi:hypothetical protein